MHDHLKINMHDHFEIVGYDMYGSKIVGYVWIGSTVTISKRTDHKNNTTGQ